MPQSTIFGASQPREFTKAPAPPQKRRPKISALWEYAADLDKEGNAPFSTTPGREHQRVFRCTVCIAQGNRRVRQYELTGGNIYFCDYLLKHHKITLPSATDNAIEKSITEVNEVKKQELWNYNVRAVRKRERLSTASDIEAVQLRCLFLNWITADNLPFSLVESEAFRTFLEYINHNANQLLPRSHSTARKDLTATMQLRLPLIIKAIAKARSKVHLIYDGWMSINHMVLFGVHARFLDENYQL